MPAKKILLREVSRWIKENPDVLKIQVGKAVKAYCDEKKRGHRSNVVRDIAIATELNQQVKNGNLNALLTFVKGENKERKIFGISRGPSVGRLSLMHYLCETIYKQVNASERVKERQNPFQDLAFDCMDGEVFLKDNSPGYNHPYRPIDRACDTTLQELLEPGLTELIANKGQAPAHLAQQQKEAKAPPTKQEGKKAGKSVSWGTAEVREELKPPRYIPDEKIRAHPQYEQFKDTKIKAVRAENERQDEIVTKPSKTVSIKENQKDLKKVLDGIREAQRQDETLETKKSSKKEPEAPKSSASPKS